MDIPPLRDQDGIGGPFLTGDVRHWVELAGRDVSNPRMAARLRRRHQPRHCLTVGQATTTLA